MASSSITCNNIWTIQNWNHQKIEKLQERTCRNKFCDRVVELTNVPAILHNKNVETKAHKISAKFVTPTTADELVNPIRSKMVNVNNFPYFFVSLDIDSFVKNRNNDQFSCSDSSFIDKDHDHILTGDLMISENSKLCKLICKGPKFREKRCINFQEAKKNIFKSVLDCISTWCERKALPTAEMMDWRESICIELDRRIYLLQK